MTSIVQRAAQRAVLPAHRSLLRYASVSSRISQITDISTEPEPLENYNYAPPVSRQHLPPKGWEDNLMRRNYGDPLPEQDELLSMWGPDIPPPGVTPNMALRHFLLAVTGFTGIFFTVKTFLTPETHFIRRTYPHDGLVTELGGLSANKARVEEENEE